MNDAELTVNTIAELQDKIATQREVICNLTSMNDELQAKLDKIEQILDDYALLDAWKVLGFIRLVLAKG